MNFDVEKRDPHSRGQSDVGPRNNSGYHGPSRVNCDDFSGSILPAEIDYDDPVADGVHKRIEEQPCARDMSDQLNSSFMMRIVVMR